MISIIKPRSAPAILAVNGVTKKEEHCTAYSLNKAKYCSSQLKFSFSRYIYNHPTVKDSLVVAQHSKCCFCESKVGHDGDVEHFRPKSAVSIGASNALVWPGYYWLAYDWDNLLLSCSACNQRAKGNAFPLRNPRRRARSHADDYRMEKPIFINPTEEDPQKYITFRKEIPRPIRRSTKGEQTISGLDLKRKILNDRRRDYLKILETMRILVQGQKQTPVEFKTAEFLLGIEEAKLLLEHCTEDDAEFAGMCRANGF